MKKISFIPVFILLFTLLFTPSIKASTLQDVPHIQQFPELPRGCEVTSLAMLLQYAGIDIDKMTLAEEIPKVPFESDGFRGDPNEGFVGNMYDYSQPGYGVYHEPVYQLAKQYLPERAIDLTGEPIEQIYEMVDLGSPVWVITNSRFSPLSDGRFETWQTKNGEVSITYHEHSVIVTGYDDQYVYINDPLYHAKDRAVDRVSFEKAWIQMGSQAISYIPEEMPPFFDSKDHWTHKSVLYAVNQNYMSGYSKYLFGPRDEVTRAQLAATLLNYLPEAELVPVRSEDAILSLAEAGVVSGYGTTFKPNESVTRAQLSAILDEIYPLAISNNGRSAQDVSTDHWAYQAIQKVRTAGIMTGSKTHFYPYRSLKRGELAVILKRLDQWGQTPTELSH